ncbi:MAG: hypothetical protein PUE01_04790 [Clostridiaceae bacterium]|nr:hypothetical protein [Clostridiaceae bacterium]
MSKQYDKEFTVRYYHEHKDLNKGICRNFCLYLFNIYSAWLSHSS